MKTPSARYFMRREDYQPRHMPRDSPFRHFDVTVSDATAQMFDPADPDRPVKAFLQEYHP